MNKLSLLCGLGIWAILVPGAMADEPPYLEFVHGLRARGMPDLAIEYLERLSTKPPPGLAPLLPLEMARTRLEMAAREPDAGRRAAAQNQARADFETFLRNNPNHPLAAAARLEIARVTSMQGKAQLSRAKQTEDRAREQAEMLRARAQFEDAARRLQDAAKQIDVQLASLGGSTGAEGETPKEALTEAKLQAQLELGLNLLDQAETFTEQNDLARRGEIIKQASVIFDTLAKRDAGNRLGLTALAWLGRCHLENDDPEKARKVLADVLAARGDNVEAARRLARYFRMLILVRNPDPKNKRPWLEVQKAGQEWLNRYADHLDTPEGLGVRYELANSYFQQAMSYPKNQQRTADVTSLLEKAKKLFGSLEASENEYTGLAHDRKLAIILVVSQGRARGDLQKLRDFEECYLDAQSEVALIQADSKKKLPAEELEKARKQHFANMIAALNRGLDLAGAKDPAEEVDDARYLLTYAYLAGEEYYRAVVLGEDLARTQPRSRHSPLAAAYALRAYALLIGKQEQAGTTREELEPDRQRLRSLAQYVEQTWPTDAAADVARHLVGLMYVDAQDYASAVEILDRVSPGYADATRSLYLLASSAMHAQKNGLKPPDGKPDYQARAIAALKRMPDLVAAADAGTVRSYVGSRQLLVSIYYKAKQFKEIEELASRLLTQLEATEGGSADNRTTVLSWVFLAKLGQAEAEASAGHFAAARDILEPVVNRFKDPAQAAALAELKEKDPQVLRAVLGMALRANVQDDKLLRGKEILELLQRLFPDSYMESLVQLIQQLKDQVKVLREQGESAQVQLDKTVKNFSTFLDELAKQQEKNPKPDVTLFLAQSYSSLDDHARAAELLRSITAPAASKTEAELKQFQIYQLARILYVRELRLSKEFDKAKASLDEILAADWGKRRPDAQKERICLLEDQGIYSGAQGAIKEWDKMMHNLKPRVQDNKVKEHYFDCYYHLTYCIFKNAQKHGDKRGLRVAATFVQKLDSQTDAIGESTKKRFEELMQKEPQLREEYDMLKKESAS